MTLDSWLALVDEIGPQLVEGAAERDANHRFGAEHTPMLRERGLLAMLVPTELGGGGASHTTAMAVLRRLASYDPSTALALSMHQHLVAAQVFIHRKGKKRATATLRRVADEGLVLVSTGARDWFESNGEMVRVDGGYRVTARKAFASGSPAGSVLVTSAPYEDPEDGWKVLHFPVPLSTEGVTLNDDWKVHGMCATGSQTVLLRDVFVPDSAIALVRPRSGFHPVWSVVLTIAMPLISAVYVGIADRAEALAQQLVDPLRADGLVQWAMGEARSQRVVAETALGRMAELAADLDFTPEVGRTDEVLILKTTAVTAAQRALEAAMEAVGGGAFSRRNGLERLLRDVRAGRDWTGSGILPAFTSRSLGIGGEPTARSDSPRSSQSTDRRLSRHQR